MALLVILLIMFVANMALRAIRISQGSNSSNKDDFIVVLKPKVCPPHQWRSQDVRDQEGKIVTSRLVCELCGPFKP